MNDQAPDAPAVRTRRSRNALSRELVVQTAMSIADADGMPAMTIRTIAALLDASPMSIYTHVANRDDLVLAMLEKATENLPIEVPGVDARQRLHARFAAAHDVLAPRTWVLLTLIQGDVVPTNSFPFANACVADFIEAGFSPAEAIYAHGVSWHLMLGEILDRHPPPRRMAETQRERALIEMSPDEFPAYATVVDVMDPTDAPPPCQFRRSYDILLRGLLPAPLSAD